MRKVLVTLELQFPDKTKESYIWETIEALVQRTQEDLMNQEGEEAVLDTVEFKMLKKE